MTRNDVIVLMYHGLGEDAGSPKELSYTVPTGEFERQLDVVARSCSVLEPRELGAGAGGIVFTFDDGYRSVLDEALPRLAAMHATGVVFAPTAFIGRRGYLGPNDLRALVEAGWLVGSHGHTHRNLACLPAGELAAELRTSRDVLGEILGVAPTDLSLPLGGASPAVIRAARAAGFQRVWSSKAGTNGCSRLTAPIRRTVIRRGESLERFERLVRGAPLTHYKDRFDAGMRLAVRRVLGDRLYKAITSSLWLAPPG